MTKKFMSKEKYHRMMALSDDHGVINAMALDQRGSLVKGMKTAAEKYGKVFKMDMVYDFKEIVSKELSQLSSAILLDDQMGFKGIKAKSEDTGLIMSYEKTGYDADTPGRLPSLIPDQSAQIMVQRGADALKVLVYYNPNDPDEINDVKKAFAQRYGTEGLGAQTPTFFEIVTYDDKLDSKSFEFAKIKPELVLKSVQEFTQDKYHIDVLKVEVPFNPTFVKGWSDSDNYAYTEDQAKDYFKQLDDEMTRPYIFLSGGVPTPIFQRQLKLAGQAGAKFNGVLSGRATWLESVDIWIKDGKDGLVDWLRNKGVQNVKELTEILSENATPWFEAYGGMDNIEVVDTSDLK
ncbi:tagatose 1,6-diphosphate aldolase [Lentilactobacillus fungorum]|uniref:Tagatose 1,6-diphosphate aldolase n=1 Tax=Lentilactobacillus fungorum TaxID=2201250 RepID=A0ABQ3W2K0_9LACO|nr:tagatose 1,6-diphosphate aldolase [Lentilactobacillus fungorum]GHP14641.1 tagatose 1,6-diphosphate aldolase [Lentilactobacillus fungorum]